MSHIVVAKIGRTVMRLILTVKRTPDEDYILTSLRNVGL
jgi:hypothetical protein